jgi:signal transduction histidine kinase
MFRSTAGTASARAGVAARVVILAACLALAAFSAAPARQLPWALPVLVFALLAVVTQRMPRLATLTRAAEIGVTVLAVSAGGREGSPLLPYLIAPVFAAGVSAGQGAALLGTGVVAGGLGAAMVAADGDRAFALACAQWVVMALLAGLTGATVRRLRAEATAGATETPYEEAYRLLSQLYSVTRHLPGSLDPMAIADRLLDAVAGVAPFTRAAVLVRTKGDRLVPLAHRAGGQRLDWDTSLRSDNLISEAWASQISRVGAGTLPASGAESGSGSTLVVPIRIGVRTFGVLALDTTAPGAHPEPVVRQVEQVVQEAALRLATGLLFDEVRELATAEERRRLAREIHDGIAQELASLGYVVDALTGQARLERSDGLAQELADLRQQITRLVSEVRLSIFDLRSDVDRHGGLGAALAEYLRTIGTSSDLIVHLTLDEEPRRLPAESEAELLRIAQEAINNARRHAGAVNLWVTCRVDPPRAQIVVEDDGRGLGTGRNDSFGLEIMRERAARLGAVFEVGRRDPRGTRVEVVLGQLCPPGEEPGPASAGADRSVPAVAAKAEKPAQYAAQRTAQKAGQKTGQKTARKPAGNAAENRSTGGIRANDSAAG